MNGYRQGGHGDPQTEDLSFSWRAVTVAYQGARGPAGFTTTNADQAAADAPVCAQLTDHAGNADTVAGYLDLPAAPGESLAKAHADEIELQSFCFAASTNTPGDASFGSFTVEKRYDRATPVLLGHMAGSKVGPLGDATVTLTRPIPAGGVEDFLTFKFGGVRPDGYRQGGDGDPLAEDVSFDWDTVAVDYRPQLAGDTWSHTR
jgi:type VI protein secretion system component Hcp